MAIGETRRLALTGFPSLSRIIGMEGINGDKLRGHLETMILSTLEGGEAHGLEILRRLGESG
jgi:hypothetical protein